MKDRQIIYEISKTQGQVRLSRLTPDPATGELEQHVIPPPPDHQFHLRGIDKETRILALAMLIDYLEDADRAERFATDFVFAYLCHVSSFCRINGDRILQILEEFETKVRSSQEE